MTWAQHQAFGLALSELMHSAEEEWPDQDPDFIFGKIGQLCETFDQFFRTLAGLLS